MHRQTKSGAHPLLFIHGSLSSSRMWRPYVKPLGAGRPVHAVDLIGYGDGAPPPAGKRFRLGDEVASIRAEMDALGGKIDVVAHSYGGAVALRLALENPSRVASLTLIEPTCFQVLADLGPASAAADAEIAAVADMVTRCVALGMLESAAARFVDYWNGAGGWRAMLPSQRETVLARIAKVPHDFSAIYAEPITLARYRKVVVPTLIVAGTQSPAPARMVASALARVLSRGSLLTVQGAGHMLPVTHTGALSEILIDRFGARSHPMALAG